ncbi:restriction endonuclease subunit S, partial [Escherichia coli]|nr:restriction endonuclease subunit S [Escherichia coli]
MAKFGAASDGVRIGQWDLDISRMRNIEVSLPQADEQAAIVKYLAHANARIDKAISAKR